ALCLKVLYARTHKDSICLLTCFQSRGGKRFPGLIDRTSPKIVSLKFEIDICGSCSNNLKHSNSLRDDFRSYNEQPLINAKGKSIDDQAHRSHLPVTQQFGNLKSKFQPDSL